MTPGRGFCFVDDSDRLYEFHGLVIQYTYMDTPKTPAIPNISPVRFVREVVAELKKVTWPTRFETVKLTVVVVVISVIVGAFIGGLDATFVKLTSLLYYR